MPIPDDQRLEHVKHALESRRQLRQATMNFEHAGLRVLFLLNGGGLIAFLTFLGTGVGAKLGANWQTHWTLIFWLLGVVLAGFATALAYRSQFHFYVAYGEYQRFLIDLNEYPALEERTDEQLKDNGDKYTKFAVRCRCYAHLLGLSSLVAFALGAFFSILGWIV